MVLYMDAIVLYIIGFVRIWMHLFHKLPDFFEVFKTNFMSMTLVHSTLSNYFSNSYFPTHLCHIHIFKTHMRHTQSCDVGLSVCLCV